MTDDCLLLVTGTTGVVVLTSPALDSLLVLRCTVAPPAAVTGPSVDPPLCTLDCLRTPTLCTTLFGVVFGIVDCDEVTSDGCVDCDGGSTLTTEESWALLGGHGSPSAVRFNPSRLARGFSSAKDVAFIC